MSGQQSKTPWTPGPWITDAELGQHVEAWVAPDEHDTREGFCVCRLDCHGREEPEDKRKLPMRFINEEDLANARLIAAAPEMAELLGKIANCLHGDGSPVQPATTTAWITEARALLARIGAA